MNAAHLPYIDLHVLPEWIDEYGHMNAARYVSVIDRLGFELLDGCGVGIGYTNATGCGIYTAELSTRYHREVLSGDPLRLQLRVLESDDKRLLAYFELIQTRDGYLSASAEQLSLNVNLTTRRVTPFPDAVREQLASQVDAHARHPLPAGFVRRVSMRRA